MALTMRLESLLAKWERLDRRSRLKRILFVALILAAIPFILG